MSPDIADLASRHETNERNVALSRVEVYSGVSAAKCQECGSKIPETRRLAVPGVQFCRECQEEKEDAR